MAVKKIAVLGGGIGSLTTVYHLTADPEWKSKYDITVYHMGWRLGGKGASGRNGTPASNGLVSERIEEHGLHLWFGFYDNAFNLIQQCYKDNNRQPGMPLATWEEAFTGYNMICLEEEINGEWLHWPFTIPSNGLTPGEGFNPPSVPNYLPKILDWMYSVHTGYNSKKSAIVKERITAFTQSDRMKSIDKLMATITIVDVDSFTDTGSFLIYGGVQVAASGNYNKLLAVLSKLEEWLKYISEGLLMSDTDLRRDVIMIDLGLVTIRGMIEDNVIKGGFDAINCYDYRQWLTKNGALDITVSSALVQAVYGLVFGGKEQYTFEAGTALRGLLRLGLTYKGHVYYRMMAGMGDAIFGPIYQVLMSRGVNIQFCNKVTNIGLSADKNSIATISIDVQASLKPEYPVYNPLVTVNELPCWPSEPNYEQLVQGDELQSQNVNLESYYSTWQSGLPAKVLNVNTDFDIVVLGISIGALPTIASEFTKDSWKAMIANVIPVSTIAYQLWLKTSIEQMGWPYNNMGLALLGSYQEPYDTWADMSDLIDREAWPAGYVPQNIAYFCGPTPQPYADEILKNAQTGNFGNPDFPAQQTQVAKDNALAYLQTLSQHIWPGLWPQGQTSFNFDQLIDLNNGTGAARFDAQFFRSNVDPTELYVMSFTDSSKYRIKTDKTGYENLYITGDWIDNGFNAGCIEATVMSGLQAARAVSGEDFEIPGEKDF